MGTTGAEVSVDEARMPRCEVCIDDATVQIEVNGPPAETISTLEPGLGQKYAKFSEVLYVD